MGVELQQYRSAVGSFNLQGRKNKTSYKLRLRSDSIYFMKVKNDRKVTIRDIFISIIIWGVLISASCSCNSEIRDNPSSNRPLYLRAHIPIRNSVTNPPSGLLGFSIKLTNKLSHIINGNRRNIGYTYMTWNCDKGFLTKNKIDDIKLAATKYNPHVIGVSEVNFKRNESNKDDDKMNNLTTEQLKNKLEIPDYKIFLPESWEQHGLARIILYVKEDLKAKVKYPSMDTSQLQTITLELGYGRSKTHLFNFYYREWTNCVRGNRDNQEADLDLLLDIWRECTENQSDFIAMGDMNVCAKKINDPAYEHAALANKIKDFLLEEDCSQIVDEYTRIRKVGSEIQRSCLDHITINCPGKVSTPKIVGVGSSDHMGTILTKSSREIRSNPRSVKKRIYKNFDKQKFRQDIIKAKEDGLFDPIHNTESEENAYDTFVKVFTGVLDKHAPVKVILNRNNYVPYLNSDLKTLMLERNLLKEVAAKTGSSDDYDKYKQKRNEVTTRLKDAEVNHNKAKFSEDNLGSAEVWKSAKQILGANRSSFPTQILAEGKLISNPLEMAKAVNKFFLNKIIRLKEDSKADHTTATKGLETYLESKDIPEEGFKLRELNDVDVSRLVKKLKGKKSCGVDWICGMSLKIVAKDLIPELKTMINLSIRNNRFTKQWKTSKILPAFKNKGTRFDLKNYRPLSNLPEVSKLAERAVYDQLFEYLVKHSLIHPNHHGYLSNCSTSTALQQMYDVWLQALDEGNMAAVLFLDLSAGFDVVNHEILLKKLDKYNFHIDTLKWFESYLCERLQGVQVESAMSPPLPVPYGVPQGSILGPLLFLLYVNELPEVIRIKNNEENNGETKDEVVVYADDTTSVTADSDPEILIQKIQRHAEILPAWFRDNDLVVSGEKTKMMVVATSANRANNIIDTGLSLNIEVCNEIVKESESEKLLGLIVNNSATWHHHLYGNQDNPGLLKQLSQRIGILKQVRRFMTDRQFRMVKNGIFTSKLLYCITTWGGIWGLEGMDEEVRKKVAIRKEDMRRLQVLQNRSMRVHKQMPRDTPTTALLNQCQELSVHQLVAYHSGLQAYKVFTTQQPTYHYNRLFGDLTSTRTRSNTNHESRIDFKLSLARTSFFYQSSRIWSQLPYSIKTAKSLETFKRAMKNWVKQNISIKP